MNVPLMGTVEKERRAYFSVANVLTLLTMVGAIAGVWASNAADSADTKRRVTTLEHGEQSTRKLIKETTDDIKNDVKQTKESVNLILQELRSMQAVQRDRDRRNRGQ